MNLTIKNKHYSVLLIQDEKGTPSLRIKDILSQKEVRADFIGDITRNKLGLIPQNEIENLVKIAINKGDLC